MSAIQYQSSAFLVHTVVAASTDTGTFALVRSDVEPLDSLLDHVSEFRTAYGNGFGTETHTEFGGGYGHRWTWEHFTPSGKRVVDTVWATPIH